MTRPVDKSKDNEAKSFGFVTFAREHVAKDLVKQVRYDSFLKIYLDVNGRGADAIVFGTCLIHIC